MQARIRGEAEANGALAASKEWQRTAVPALLVFTTLFGLAILGFIVYANVRGP